jgi:hypothetical protein
MSHIFIIPIVFANLILFIISNNMEILSIFLITIGFIILIYIKNNISRKDTLNIIKYNNRVYFSLSDDIYFSVDIFQNSIFDDRTLSNIEKKILEIKEDIYRIEFINFYDEKLYNRLNELIEAKE